MIKLFLYLMLSVLSCSINADCPTYNNSGPAHQTSDFHKVYYACSGIVIRLHCCVSGENVTIQWLYNDTQKGWIDAIDYFIWVDSSNHNQTVTIEDPVNVLHNGTWKCVVKKNNLTQFSNTAQLSILSCNKRVQKPKSLTKSQDFENLSGANRTILCEAFFGQDTSGPIESNGCLKTVNQGFQQNISWYRVPDTRPLKNKPGKYDINLSCRKDSEILSKSLIIYSISDADYGTYQCDMTNRYGTTREQFKLNKVKTSLVTPWQIIGVILGVFGVVIIILILVVIYNGYHTLLMVYCKDHQSTVIREDCVHDVVFVYNDIDGEGYFVQQLKKELENETLGYQCIEENDFLPGTQILPEYIRSLENSKTAVFVLSPSLLKNSSAELLYRYAVDHQMPIVCVQFRKISSTDWSSYSDTDDLKYFRKAMTCSKKIIKWNEGKKCLYKLRKELPPAPAVGNSRKRKNASENLLNSRIPECNFSHEG